MNICWGCKLQNFSDVIEPNIVFDTRIESWDDDDIVGEYDDVVDDKDCGDDNGVFDEDNDDDEDIDEDNCDRTPRICVHLQSGTATSWWAVTSY